MCVRVPQGVPGKYLSTDRFSYWKKTTFKSQFRELIELLHQQAGNVVILIDEYDKPIIHGIEKDNADLAETNQDILKSFYGILKDSGEYLRFVFITGVSKFSKVSIFSDMNYFDDLTLNNQFATMCGFTEAEIRQYCYGGLEDLAVQENTSIEAVMDKIRFWYNGFSWNAKDFVYNPYSTMHLMDSLEFKNYWFESGTPTFLVKLINARYTYNMKDIKVKASVYDWYDLRNLDFYSIMLQTGYLTFKKSLGNDYFIVNYPNKEVENAFCEMLLSGYFHKHPFHISVTIHDIEEAIENHEIEKAIGYIKDMFKTLPSQFFQEVVEKTDANGNVTKVFRAVPESFYHAIFYLIFNILGIKMQAEVTAQEGRIDAVVETEGYIYLFEFKKNRKASVALDQIKTKKYAELYALSKKQVFLVGVSFSLQKRGISDYLIAPYSPS